MPIRTGRGRARPGRWGGRRRWPRPRWRAVLKKRRREKKNGRKKERLRSKEEGKRKPPRRVLSVPRVVSLFFQFPLSSQLQCTSQEYAQQNPQLLVTHPERRPDAPGESSLVEARRQSVVVETSINPVAGGALASSIAAAAPSRNRRLAQEGRGGEATGARGGDCAPQRRGRSGRGRHLACFFFRYFFADDAASKNGNFLASLLSLSSEKKLFPFEIRNLFLSLE